MGLKAQSYNSCQNDGFTNQKINIVKKTMLNCLDVKIVDGKTRTNNKYYAIEIQEANGKYRIFTDYGRVGFDGVKECRYPEDLWEAEKEFDAIVKKKKKGKKDEQGYVEIDVAQANKGSEEAKNLIDTTKVTIIKQADAVKVDLHPQVIKLVTQFYEEAGSKLNNLINGDNDQKGSPLGKLSVDQINVGRKILQDIANLINNDNKNLLDPSKEYYRAIPKAFGRNMRIDDVIIGSLEEVSNQMETLDFYEDALRIGDVIYDDSLMKKYDALKTEIRVLEDKTKYDEICHYVNKSQSRHHSFSLRVNNIYEVVQKNAPKFVSVGNERELFHGTRSANMIGILSSNLKLPNQLKGVYITGAMFGPGIYFADSSSKSAQYSFGRFGGSRNKYQNNFMFLCNVSLGNIKEVQNSHYFYEAPRGYHSVKGCKGMSLLHNEYIVYKENQAQIKYIIDFNS